MQDYEEDFCDLETMRFVNPYEINPIATTRPQTTIMHQQQQVSVNPIPSVDVTTQNALKMEEFSDLSALLMGANVEFIDSTDELNTPVFDKEAFNFPQQSTPAKPDKIKANPKVKLETLQHYSYSDLKLSAENQVYTKENCCSWGNEQSEMNLYHQPFAHSLYNQGAYSPVFLQDNTAINQPSLYSTNLSSNNYFNSTTTSPQDDRYSCISSPADLQPEPTGKEPFQHKLRLNLMAEQFKFPIKEEAISTLNTPDVIDEVVQMGTEFNILDLVDNEDISVINEDEAFVSTLTSPTAFESEPSTPSTNTSRSSSIRRTKKRKMFQLDDADDGDDDDDYIPPAYKKRSSAYRLADNDMENSDSSDDSLDQPTKFRKQSISVSKTRGRPPKRGESVSSDGSKDQDVSKYRELRDKNNEASRKSRLKRKVQERESEKEAAELYANNIRLKTQVEELEKMVESFRNNIFKILVTK